MSSLALVHVALGLVVLALGAMIVAARKGDARHRRFGWAYVSCMAVSLVAIVVAGRDHFAPFHAFAGAVLLALVIAGSAPRLRRSVRAWRIWHGALMSFTLLAALIAVGGVAGGVLIGVGKGPAYYRMFNVVIGVMTLIGLTVVATRPVIWGHNVAPHAARARIVFATLVVCASAALIVAQMSLR
jgi:uncharacterized membrane protein